MSTGPDAIERQQGVWFLCPKCYADNGNSAIGTHHVLCWFLNPRVGPPVSDEEDPKPGRWTREGETIETLTLGPGKNGARSVLLTGGCGWHGFVTNGDAT